MAKRKRSAKSKEIQPAAAPLPAHFAAKKPIALTISIILFALWFIFLLVTALSN